MHNQLATHLTRWKAWYALLAAPALIIGSSVMLLSGADADGQGGSVRNAWMVPVQFLAFASIILIAVGLVARKFPTVQDVRLTRGMTKRDLVIVAIVFVVSHLLFYVLALGQKDDPDQARRYFDEGNFGGPLLSAAAMLIASVILAPVCEEILYRVGVLRPIHDAMMRRGRTTAAPVVAILASAVAFSLPHLGDSLTGVEAMSYLVTGSAFGVVYVLTGSLTAAMVSHSLQSCYAFSQILIFGHGAHDVSPLLYVIAFGCPLWTYLCARALRALLPDDRPLHP